MDKYEIKEMIGSGTYSNVYRAMDKGTYEAVAIKIMKKPYAQHKNTQDLQLNSLKKFSYNPCVIQIKEVIVHEGILHIVFELLKTNLIDYYKELKKRQGRGMREEEIQSVVYQIALSLRDIHREGFAHRDIKPENMLVTLKPKGFLIDQIKLVDFGLTKKLEKKKNTNYIATRWYRSPELLLGINYDSGVDVFALGCVMIEMYLGYEAFQGKDTLDQLNKQFVVLGTPTQREWPEAYALLKKGGLQLPHYQKISIKDNIPGTSHEAANLIQKMISPNPKDRISIEQVLSHRYFNSVRDKLPDAVKRYLNKGAVENVPKQIKYGTATTSNEIGNEINQPNYMKAYKPPLSPNRPLSNTSNNVVINTNQQRPTSNYVMQQRGVSPSSSDHNKSFNPPLSPRRNPPPTSTTKPKPQLDPRAQTSINKLAANLYKQSPKQLTFQKSYDINPLRNKTPKVKQQISRPIKAEQSPDYLIGPIHVNSRAQKVKRTGIHVTHRNIKTVPQTLLGCFNFILGQQEEIVLEYKGK